MSNTPTLHKPVPMNSRVNIAEEIIGPNASGTVIGISSIGIIFHYIVLLDSPIQSEFGEQRAVSVSGCQLDSEDRLTNWQIK